MGGINKQARRSWVLYAFAARHKGAALVEGFVTNQSLWDRLVFDGARATVLGHAAATLRAVIVSGGLCLPCPLLATADWDLGSIANALLEPARVALSVPLVIAHTSALCGAPVLASHPLDLQALPGKGAAPAGPPGINVEVKLLGLDDEAVEGGADPVGALTARGPSVGQRVPLGAFLEGVESVGGEEWTAVGGRARVQTNGAFVVL